jgi:hypothetical protein
LSGRGAPVSLLRPMKKEALTKRGLEEMMPKLMSPFMAEMKSFVHSALREHGTSIKDDLKDFVRSEIKANNVTLRKEMDAVVAPLRSDIKLLQHAVSEHSSEIKQNRVEEIRDSEERLGNKIDKNAIRLDDHETRITHLEEAR